MILARLVILALLVAPLAVATADEPPTFERDVKAVLAKRCTVCHNTKKIDDLDVSGGLALDSFDAALRGTKEHKVIEPGKVDGSELLKRLDSPDEDQRMPLGEDPLPEAQRALIRRWVEAGALRGEPKTPATVAATAPKTARRVVRTLDVVLPTDVKIPKGTEGFGPGGPLATALKVGPLPAVTALAFRGDGRLLAVGTSGEVVLWDLAEAAPAAVLTDVSGSVHALAFSPDGRRLAVGAGLPARSGSLRIYAVPDGTLEHDLNGHSDVVYGLAFRPDGAQLASASFDKTVRFWDLTTGKPSGEFTGHSDFVYDVAYATDGKTVLSVSKDRSVKRLDTATSHAIRTYSDHNDEVLALAVRPDGSGFISAGQEPQLRWWEGDGDKPAKKVSGHGGPVHQLAFSGDGALLISASGDKSARLWDGKSGVFKKTLPGPTEWQYAVALSQDGRLAAAGGWDGLVRVWSTDKGALLATLIQPPSESPGQAEWLVASPAGFLNASPGLLPLIRWRVGGADLSGDAASSAFLRPDQVAHSLAGEPTAALESVLKPKDAPQ